MNPTDYPECRVRAAERLVELHRQIIIAQHQESAAQQQLFELRARETQLLSRAELLQQAIVVVQQLVDRVSAQNIARVESLVNSALRTIFVDLDVEFRLISEIKRNQNTYRIAFFRDGVEGSIHSIGGGVAAVASVVLKLLFNRFARRFPLLVLDETLAFLSAQYIPACSRFLRELSAEFGMIFVLVTHQPRFAAAADLVYEIESAAPHTSRVSLKDRTTPTPDDRVVPEDLSE